MNRDKPINKEELLRAVSILSGGRSWEIAKKLEEVYAFLGWKWAYCGIPTALNIDQTINMLANDLAKRPDPFDGIYASTGGITVTASTGIDGVRLEVSMDLSWAVYADGRSFGMEICTRWS